jgi:hypothetical protein
MSASLVRHPSAIIACSVHEMNIGRTASPVHYQRSRLTCTTSKYPTES